MSTARQLGACVGDVNAWSGWKHEHDPLKTHYWQSTNHGRSHLSRLSCLLIPVASPAGGSAEAATSLVHAFISCRLDYCNTLIRGIADNQLQRLQSVQNAAARLVTGLRRTEHITTTLKSLHWLPIRQPVSYKLAMVHKCLRPNGRALEYLAEFSRCVDQRPGMRSAARTRTQTSFCDSLFAVAGPHIWNNDNLPDPIRDFLSFLTFTKLLKSHRFVWLPRRLWFLTRVLQNLTTN